MKLIANNFTGIFISTGDRYRIDISDKKYSSLDKCRMFTNVYIESKGRFICDPKLSVTKWYQKGNYRKALKECLLLIETKLGVDLIRKELNENVA
ncbi:hypothetical protein PL371_10725 [Tenacibaculum maritimum]|nr:hypothetical protein [Tenacibaculum maritimum]MDB0612331.1 hypothetical protein [Tenacibaculum maritimum]